MKSGNNSDFLKTDINVIANDRRERGNLIFLYLTNRLLRRFAPRNDKKQCFLENLKHYVRFAGAYYINANIAILCRLIYHSNTFTASSGAFIFSSHSIKYPCISATFSELSEAIFFSA